MSDSPSNAEMIAYLESALNRDIPAGATVVVTAGGESVSLQG